MTAMAAKGPALPRIGGPQSSQERTALLGMTLFIASWAMLFAGLFFAYGAIRLRTPAWPPFDLPRIPLGIPTIATLFLLGSSGLLELTLTRIRRQAPGLMWPAIAGAALCAAAFLGLQFQVWRDLYLQGLRPSTGTYASVFYGLTVFHALHVAVGICALTYLALATAFSREARSYYLSLRLWTIYWHMVGIIWGVMFILVYWI